MNALMSRRELLVTSVGTVALGSPAVRAAAASPRRTLQSVVMPPSRADS
jgi:hypothetical protein